MRVPPQQRCSCSPPPGDAGGVGAHCYDAAAGSKRQMARLQRCGWPSEAHSLGWRQVCEGREVRPGVHPARAVVKGAHQALVVPEGLCAAAQLGCKGAARVKAWGRKGRACRRSGGTRRLEQQQRSVTGNAAPGAAVDGSRVTAATMKPPTQFPYKRRRQETRKHGRALTQACVCAFTHLQPCTCWCRQPWRCAGTRRAASGAHRRGVA